MGRWYHDSIVLVDGLTEEPQDPREILTKAHEEERHF